MDKSLLVGLFGFPATLIHGDTLVLDRWLWLRHRLRGGRRGKLIDIGCGSGAFSIGAAKLGYESIGLSWDERNQAVASRRAALCGTNRANFQVLDMRRLDERADLRENFDVAICCEVVEHILDDAKVLSDIAGCLARGGYLLLTTPNIGYRSITRDDDGPFAPIEDGRHVRKGYSAETLEGLCSGAGLSITEVSTCSGFLSQKITALLRHASRLHPMFGWLLIAPLRVLPPLLDPLIARLTGWPDFSICIVARKT